MRYRRNLIGITAGLMLGLFEPAGAQTPIQPADQPSQPIPTFKAGVDLVSVSAVVRDRKGRVVRNLAQRDFEVMDQGKARKIVDFSSNEEGPMSLALLFDVSGSMDVAYKIEAAKMAAQHIMSWLQPSVDEAAIFTFDSKLRQVHGFTDDRGLLTESLKYLQPFGATSLYDAIAETARQVSARTVKRRGILVLTDGVDTYSKLTSGEVSSIASSIDVPVYLFAVVSPVDHPGGPDEIGGSATVPLTGALANLARWTGGDLFVISTPAHASLAARQLLQELRHQYLIAFESAGDAGWHRLEIRTRDRDLSVRTRSGYVAGQSGPVPSPDASGGYTTD